MYWSFETGLTKFLMESIQSDITKDLTIERRKDRRVYGKIGLKNFSYPILGFCLAHLVIVLCSIMSRVYSKMLEIRIFDMTITRFSIQVYRAVRCRPFSFKDINVFLEDWKLNAREVASRFTAIFINGGRDFVLTRQSACLLYDDIKILSILVLFMRWCCNKNLFR